MSTLVKSQTLSGPDAYLFADGSSSRNDDIGAWAAVAVSGDRRKLLYGITYPTTISRCELMPIIEGLRWIKRNWAVGGFRVSIISDSEYTIKTAAGEYARRKNEELWAALDEACQGLKVRYIWRERNCMLYTTVCDGICSGLRRQTIDTLKKVFTDVRQPEQDIPLENIDARLYAENTDETGH